MFKKFYDPTKPFGEQVRKIIEETHPPQNIQEIKVRRVGKRYSLREVSPYWNNFDTMTTTDGTGTKGSLIWHMKAFDTAAIDPFAMAIDDLYEHNYEPYKLQSHLILQEEDRDVILRVITSLKDLCMKFKWKTPLGNELPIIIHGGETAICNTLEGMEFAVVATGYADPKDVLEAHASDGDILIGIASNGIHSNGLTFARDGILGELKMSLYDKFDFGTTVGEELTRPTRIYLEALRALNKELKEYVTGKVHITGGAFSKLRELSREKVSYEIFNDHKLKPQDIFYFIFDKLKVPENKMLTRYNCGVGYVVSVKKKGAERALDVLNKFYPSDVIGRVIRGDGEIKVHSPFSRNIIIL